MNRRRRPTSHHPENARLDDGVHGAEFRGGALGRSVTDAVLAGGVAAVV